MKLNLFETHDRYKHFTKQNFSISECCQDLINKRPFGEHAFYIFAHPRTDDDGFTKRLIWQPRLTKPRAQSNSMLFKAYPGKDEIKIIWIIPDRTLWDQYKKGNITESNMIAESIDAFLNDRVKLEMREPDDLQDWQIDEIYRTLSRDSNHKKRIKNAC